MRRIGIVKSYGGYNYKRSEYNDFGSIYLQDMDIFVQKKELLCDPDHFAEGDIVTLDVTYDANKTKPHATKVNKFSEDSSYFVQMKQLELEKLEKIVDNDIAFLRKHSLSTDIYVNSLPNYLLEKSSNLREVLPTLKHLSLCVALWKSQNRKIKKELLEVSEKALQIDPQLIRLIPVELYEGDESFFNRLPRKSKLFYWSKKYYEKEKHNAAVVELRKLINEKNDIDLPYNILRDLAIWSNVSMKFKLDVLDKYKNNMTEQQYVSNVVSVLCQLPPAEMLGYVKKISKNHWHIILEHHDSFSCNVAKALCEFPLGKIISYIEQSAEIAHILTKHQDITSEAFGRALHNLPAPVMLSCIEKLPRELLCILEKEELFAKGFLEALYNLSPERILACVKRLPRELELTKEQQELFVENFAKGLYKLPPDKMLLCTASLSEEQLDLFLETQENFISNIARALHDLPTDKVLLCFTQLPKKVIMALLKHQNTLACDISRALQKFNYGVDSLFWIKLLPEKLLQNRNIWPNFSPQMQVIIGERVWAREKMWDNLSSKGKIYHLFKLAKEGISLEKTQNISINLESEPLVYVAYLILKAKSCDKIEKESIFQQVNRILDDCMKDYEKNIDIPIDMTPLLPKCSRGKVMYCEGIIWIGKYENWQNALNAYCPRTRTRESVDNGCPSIRANLEKPWEEWSMLELLEKSEMEPKVWGLQNHYDYVPKIAGAFNRLEELRERLHCRYCKELMQFDFRYAKNFAAYRSTVAHCRHKIENEKHDHDVYLNHCWACRKIIDSRDNKIKVEEYFLCLSCGSGKKGSSKFRQGDICPKCGSKNMVSKDNFNRIYICRDCGHKINIPAPKYQTGPTIENRGYTQNVYEPDPQSFIQIDYDEEIQF